MSAPPGPGTGAPAVHLVGSGPGPVDLLTVRATRLIALSGTVLVEPGPAGSEALRLCPPTALVVDASGLTATEAAATTADALARGDRVVRLYPGDPAEHPGFAEHTHALSAAGIEWERVPGVRAATPTTTGTPGARGLAAGSDAAANAVGAAAPPEAPTVSGPPGLILVLGGTGEARQLADLLVTAGLDVVSSLAGKVTRPRLPRGEVRIGGFGGADGLAAWLVENGVSAVIDATDPFADEISDAAVRATHSTGTPLLRLHRPPWTEQPGDEWIRVPDTAAAARVVRERFRRPMLTVGKQGASAFAGDTRGSYLIRCSEPPPGALPHRYLLVLDRGPFGVESERTLMSRHRIDVLVTRDSGGTTSEAKLAAARDLRIPVVMVDRPGGAPAAPAVETVHSVDDAARWLVERFGSR